MKDIDKQKKFVELRAKNWSFQRISDEINVSKPTLIKWSQEFSYEITNLRNMEFEALYEEFRLSREQKIIYYGNLQGKIIKELENRDLSDVKSDKLLDMLIKANGRLEDIVGNFQLSYMTIEEIEERKSDDKNFCKLIKSLDPFS